MALNYFHSNVSGKDEINQTCSSFSMIPTTSYTISLLRYNKPGRRPVVLVFNVRNIARCNVSRYISPKDAQQE